jgi:glycosyltransferase involved in cell wall biosynthesis
MKVAHIITGLSTGGAEMMLYRLAKHHQTQGMQALVFSLVSNGELKALFQADGIRVIDLGFPRGRFSFSGFLQLIKELRAWKPDLAMCWMYHANVIGGLAAKIAGGSQVLWSIHHSTLHRKKSSRLTRLVMMTGGILSWLPAKIIFCSETARSLHLRVGYQDSRCVVIPNGFDTELFHPDPGAGVQFKLQHGIPPSKRLIGIIGRYDPQKDFNTFIKAAEMISQLEKNVNYLFCGQGLEPDNDELMGLINQAGIMGRVHLIGQSSKMAQVYQSLDLLVSSSAYGEAFPMVIGEAMACGVPCIATDLGDVRLLIGQTGLIVPPENPLAIFHAVMEFLAMPSDEYLQRQNDARQRILNNFSLPKIASQYHDLFERVI